MVSNSRSQKKIKLTAKTNNIIGKNVYGYKFCYQYMLTHTYVDKYFIYMFDYMPKTKIVFNPFLRAFKI